MQAVVLAAGEGSRLFPFTAAIPKPLMPIAGKPLLARICEKLLAEEFSPLLVTCLTEFVDQFEYQLPSVEVLAHDDGPLGTAGELVHLKNVLDEEFLVYYADIWTEHKLEAMANRWNRWKWSSSVDKLPIAMLGVAPKLQVDKGVPTIEGGYIKEIREKPELEVPNLAGIGIFKKDILRYARLGEDLHRDSLAQALRDGERVLAYTLPEGYFDIGSYYSFRQAQKHFRR